MQHTGRIIFKDVPCSEALIDEISRELHELDLLCPNLVACKALVQRASPADDRVRVAIEAVVPGRVLRVGFDAVDRVEASDPGVAIADAFSAMRGELEDHLRRREGSLRDLLTPAPRFTADPLAALASK